MALQRTPKTASSKGGRNNFLTTVIDSNNLYVNNNWKYTHNSNSTHTTTATSSFINICRISSNTIDTVTVPKTVIGIHHRDGSNIIDNKSSTISTSRTTITTTDSENPSVVRRPYLVPEDEPAPAKLQWCLCQ